MRKYYRLASERDVWDELWDATEFEQALKAGHANYLTHTFRRYFPKPGKILEAGCGLGQYVVRYHQQGYDIEGVDSSSVSIAKIKERLMVRLMWILYVIF